MNETFKELQIVAQSEYPYSAATWCAETGIITINPKNIILENKGDDVYVLNSIERIAERITELFLIEFICMKTQEGNKDSSPPCYNYGFCKPYWCIMRMMKI